MLNNCFRLYGHTRQYDKAIALIDRAALAKGKYAPIKPGIRMLRLMEQRGRMFYSLRKISQYFDNFNKMIAYSIFISSPSDDVYTIVAEARMKSLEPLYKRFLRMKINPEAKNIQEEINRKASFLETLNTEYEQISVYNIFSKTVASQYKLGKSYSNYADELKIARDNRKLKWKQLVVYKKMLNEKIKSAKGKAFKILFTVYDKASLNPAQGKWFKKSSCRVSKNTRTKKRDIGNFSTANTFQI